MNKTYQAPEAEIIVFAQQDIVTTSNGGIDFPVLPFPFADPALDVDSDL